MGEFSPPPPPFSDPLLSFFSYHLNKALVLLHYYKNSPPPPHFKILDPHSCAIKSPQLYTPSQALTFILKLLVKYILSAFNELFDVKLSCIEVLQDSRRPVILRGRPQIMERAS